MQEELFAKWGLKDDCGNLAHAENGNRVLLYKYLYRHLDGLGLKAVLVRPGLIDWNVISRSHTWSKCSKKSASRCIDGGGKNQKGSKKASGVITTAEAEDSR